MLNKQTDDFTGGSAREINEPQLVPTGWGWHFRIIEDTPQNRQAMINLGWHFDFSKDGVAVFQKQIKRDFPF